MSTIMIRSMAQSGFPFHLSLYLVGPQGPAGSVEISQWFDILQVQVLQFFNHSQDVVQVVPDGLPFLGRKLQTSQLR